MAAMIVSSKRTVEIQIVGDDQFYVVGSDGYSTEGPYRINDPRFLILNPTE